MPELRLEWVPLRGVGPFTFGGTVAPHVQTYDLALTERDPITGWDVYTASSSDTKVYVEDGRIIAVGCFQECLYRGRNLIGLRLVDAIELLGGPPDPDVETYDLEEGAQQKYEFSELECQAWVKGDAIVATHCSGSDGS